MPIHIKDAGTWKLVKDVYLKQAGVWELVSTVYSKVAGTWTLVHAAEAVAIVAADVTNLDVKSLFSLPDWENAGKKKRVVINAGVIVGSTSATAALLTGTGRANDLIIENNGEIQGKGGAANSGAGGPAINIQQDGVTIQNNGAIRGGGGGGGKGGTGGTGGGGSYSSTTREPSSGEYYSRSGTLYFYKTFNGTSLYWGGSLVFGEGGTNLGPITVGSVTYYRGSERGSSGGSNYYGIYRTYPSTVNTSGGAGGAGGNGGVGQGYTQANTAGSAGSAGSNGGTNAGKGGTGGTGGDGSVWGVDGEDGATGATGASGNRTSGAAGSAGSAGGAAGAAITGLARTLVNNGTINGAT